MWRHDKLEHRLPVKAHRSTAFVAASILLATFMLGGCRAKKQPAVVDLPGLPEVQTVEDKILNEIWQFGGKTRSLYNASRFDELEALARELRAEHGRFGNGSWKLRHFYEALRCREEEPESMWQLHESIHRNWDAAKPRSITAYVAHADFLIEYAWHARSHKFADKVTKEGWRLFEQRLAQAKQVLDASASFEPKCPMWWSAALRVAIGQGWSWDDFEKLFQEAKKFDPQFWHYDISKATYLMPRWYGNQGDWEYAASLEVNRPGGLGAETYARVVDDMSGYYDNVFRESKLRGHSRATGLN
jgi:hypothetical protein